ncbi:hypothetical protein ASPFODRAFT_41216 [Aspergillus luchuensis CBS 106.47]|uniref:Uncharacterized protein n=1 Tax=Aspergillus luchuensis (strain CBS 106.47) TaxID=1137211 RepID=A0A1M3TW07_ASPLC|nr:hypothetical protein ASPFODRAFT_41216 [Aspergillus luchuensis CBS 106.47]
MQRIYPTSIIWIATWAREQASKQGTAIHFRQPYSTINGTRLCFACITQTTRPQHHDEVRVHAGGLESVSQADNADVPLYGDAWAVIECSWLLV